MIPGWEKFQHYKNRNPPWVKLYTELNRRDEWRALRLSDRGLICSLWSEWGAANGHLRAETLSSRLGQRVDSRALVRLSDAGFLIISASETASNPCLAPEEKNLEEKRRTVALAREDDKPVDNSAAAPPVEGSELIVERLIRNGVIHDLVDLEAELTGYRINGKPADRLRELL